MNTFLASLLSFCFFSLTHASAASLPARSDAKIYGVNLGSWLVVEPWMLPQEWMDMGGENCQQCSNCIGSEWAFTRAYPETADSVFNQHWESWFSQDDVTKLVDYGINTVRIPLGFWIVEPLVDRSHEFYPRGGIKQLKRGLKQLKEAGISAILDHHALPGVQTPGQMFTGNCTSNVQFYTRPNYHRALIWTTVMAALSHLDRDFGSVFAIEAVNEPIMDASQTPGYGEFQANFVKVVRAVEFALGITVPSDSRGGLLSYVLSSGASGANTNGASVTSSLVKMSRSPHSGSEVSRALADAAPILETVLIELGISDTLVGDAPSRSPLMTNFMDIGWQYNNPSNPADAQNGPQGYDSHLYYSFGGVADADPEAYMKSICNLQHVQTDAAAGNSPLWTGEWALPTQFEATDEFLNRWADAQKLTYSQGAGWIFWNFKVEKSDQAGDLARQWSYFEAVERGYLTKDPSALHDISVCADYII